jgi:hypothetical protein
MKQRNGFVSNSSSSSFIFVGFPTAELNSDLTNEQKVRGHFTQKDIDRWAIDALEKTDYNNYRKGIVPINFWDKAYEHFQSEIEYTEELPENYEKRPVWFDGKSSWWQGISIARVSESGCREFDPKTITDTIKKIKKDYPQVTPKTVLITSC